MLWAGSALIYKAWWRIHCAFIMKRTCSTFEKVICPRKTIMSLWASIFHSIESKKRKTLIKAIKSLLTKLTVRNIFSSLFHILSSRWALNWFLHTSWAVISNWAFTTLNCSEFTVIAGLAIFTFFFLNCTFIKCVHT